MSKSRSQGKGSTYRKVDRGKYDIEYDRIFGHKKNTKAYTRARLCNKCNGTGCERCVDGLIIVEGKIS